MNAEGSRGNREAAEAAARDERTLEAVGPGAWLGQVCDA
jgi:hypothetical protein